jgi:BirA family transcriptional regulator, biotin operon repressor / biotin---[acetyl-CoA-carboxylase] ligase
MKARILDHLNPSPEPISGEHLSRSLGVSRVAIWKHIRQLQELGYDIEATAKGYRLLSSPDTPFAWAFRPDRQARVHHFDEVVSTMDTAMELGRGGCPAFSVVVAEQQIQGRGRLHRPWQSARGGLYFTMVLRPAMALSDAPLINLAAALDMAATLSDLYDIQPQLKWPNDLLVQDRKLAGILSQMSAEPDRIEFINLGMGLNVHNNTQPPAVSVAALTGKAVSRVRILEGFWDRLEQRLQNADLSAVVAQWKAKTITLGRQVKVQTLNEQFEGRAVDVQDNGGLVLETADGRRMTVVYGDCFHQ